MPRTSKLPGDPVVLKGLLASLAQQVLVLPARSSERLAVHDEQVRIRWRLRTIQKREARRNGRAAGAVRVTELRQAKDLSQTDLARLMGVSRASIGKIELGDANPSPGTLAALSKALGEDLSSFWATLKPATYKPPVPHPVSSVASHVRCRPAVVGGIPAGVRYGRTEAGVFYCLRCGKRVIVNYGTLWCPAHGTIGEVEM